MTQKDALELAKKLYECSVSMEEISSTSSKMLIDMSESLLSRLEHSMLPKEIRQEIEDIKKELLND